MTPKQTYLVEIGYHAVLNMREEFSATFFGRLFEPDPDFGELYESDSHDRTSWLISSLATLMANITVDGGNGHQQPHSIAGSRILEYRFFTVGAALLWAMEDSMGGFYSPAMEEAWATAFLNHSDGMFPSFDEMSMAA